MDPQGKVALITGGTRIGQSVAEALARRGCHILVTYRTSRAAAEETIQKTEQFGVRSAAIQADLLSEKGILAVVQFVEDQFQGLDVLINMASVYRRTHFDRLDLAVWHEDLGTDLQSAYLLSLKTAPLMRRRGSGRIINFSDWTAASGRPRYRELLPYYVAKRGVLGLTEGLALELAPAILVNAIAPGPILAPTELSVEAQQEVVNSTPLRRWGGAGEVAKTVLFLIESDFITGECVRVDGGR